MFLIFRTSLICLIELNSTNYINFQRFGVTYDSWEKGAYQSGQCYSIMQRGGPKCDNCMLWSDESKKQFTDFIQYVI